MEKRVFQLTHVDGESNYVVVGAEEFEAAYVVNDGVAWYGFDKKVVMDELDELRSADEKVYYHASHLSGFREFIDEGVGNDDVTTVSNVDEDYVYMTQKTIENYIDGDISLFELEELSNDFKKEPYVRYGDLYTFYNGSNFEKIHVLEGEGQWGSWELREVLEEEKRSELIQADNEREFEHESAYNVYGTAGDKYNYWYTKYSYDPFVHIIEKGEDE